MEGTDYNGGAGPGEAGAPGDQEHCPQGPEPTPSGRESLPVLGSVTVKCNS